MTRVRLAGVFLAAVSMVAAQVQVAWAAPPSNDDINAAQEVQSLPFDDERSIAEATTEGTGGYCDSGTKGVWYRYTAPETTLVEFNTAGSNYDTVIHAYKGVPGALRLVTCNDDAGTVVTSKVTLFVQQDKSYYFLISSLSTGTDTLKVHMDKVPPPANDRVRSATRIGRLPYSTTMETTQATQTGTDPVCFAATHTVWFEFQAERDVKVVASTKGTDYDTVLGVYDGAPSPRHEVTCVEDSRGSDDIEKTIALEKGKTYLFMVGSQQATPRVLHFSLAIPLDIKVGVTGSGQVNTVTGVARVTGWYQCNTKAPVYLTGVLRQRRGDKVLAVSFSQEIDCAAKRKQWTAIVSSSSSAFHPGSAGLSVLGRARSSNDRARDRAASIVRLTGCECRWGL